MTNNIITFLLVGIIAWVCYVKYQEYQYKTFQLLSKNHLLEIENQKMKTKIRYLQNYKTDVSKTFKILNNELSLIKENLPENSVNILTPQIFNSLISAEPEPTRTSSYAPSTSTTNPVSTSSRNTAATTTSDIFSTLFNRFLSQPVSVSIEAQATPVQEQTQSPISQIQEPSQGQVHAPAQEDPVSQVPVSQVPVSQVPVSQVPVSQVPVSQVPVSQTQEASAEGVTQAPSIRLQLIENEPENEDTLTFDQAHIIERLQNEYSKYLM